ncbi:MAG: NfeD family protein [Acholeplasmatales bacterium]|nr:MAG: NfeD family protein [Acholeplasmatales bacterium]
MGINEVFVVIWFLVILVAAYIEITTMDLTSVWFAIGAIVAFILAVIGVNFVIQLFVFILLSIALLISVKPLAKNYLRTNVVSTNADRLIGKVATCVKEIAPGERGQVKVDGQIWTAITEDGDAILVNEKVEILAIEGVKLIVMKQ